MVVSLRTGLRGHNPKEPRSSPILPLGELLYTPPPHPDAQPQMSSCSAQPHRPRLSAQILKTAPMVWRGRLPRSPQKVSRLEEITAVMARKVWPARRNHSSLPVLPPHRSRGVQRVQPSVHCAQGEFTKATCPPASSS